MADIPIELIREILSRCPVKSVLRFKTVSPEWLTLILSPDFVSHHRRCSPAPILLQFRRPQPLHQLLFSYGIRSLHSNTHLHPIPTFPGSDAAAAHKLELIGSPNGVVCIVQNPDLKNFTLWNPATRSSLPLPAPTLIINPETHTRVCVGMGFNPSAGDYKIVRLLERKFNLSDQVEVLSVNRGGWTVSTSHVLRMRMTEARCVVANGVPYWIGTKSFPDLKKTFPDMKLTKRVTPSEKVLVRLVLFDVGNERFRTEEFAWEAESSRTLLGVRDDCLCAMAWDESRLGFDLWVKEGPGWTRRYAEVERPVGLLEAGFCGDRGIVFREDTEDDRLVFFDPTGVEDEDPIGVVGHFELNDRLWVLSWTDSLTQIPQLGPAGAN